VKKKRKKRGIPDSPSAGLPTFAGLSRKDYAKLRHQAIEFPPLSKDGIEERDDAWAIIAKVRRIVASVVTTPSTDVYIPSSRATYAELQSNPKKRRGRK
jgi:hypothetical protein